MPLTGIQCLSFLISEMGPILDKFSVGLKVSHLKFCKGQEGLSTEAWKGGAFSSYSGQNLSKSVWFSRPELSLFVQWVFQEMLRGGPKATTIVAQACDPSTPSHEILLFPTIPEELSRGPGRWWAGYTAACGN